MTTRTPRIVTHTCPRCGHTIQAHRTATATCQASLRCQRNGTLMVVEDERNEQ